MRAAATVTVVFSLARHHPQVPLSAGGILYGYHSFLILAHVPFPTGGPTKANFIDCLFIAAPGNYLRKAAEAIRRDILMPEKDRRTGESRLYII